MSGLFSRLDSSPLIGRIVRAGRIRHAFAASVAIGVVAVSAVTALAFYASSGSIAVTGINGAAASGTVTLATHVPTSGSAFTYAGPSTTGLAPGGTVSFQLDATCPGGSVGVCNIAGFSLASWTADAGHATAGCTNTALPAQFTLSGNSGTGYPMTFGGGTNPTTVTSPTLTVSMANLNISQNACAGASYTFNITTP